MTAGCCGCWFCICFQTRNSAPPAIATIAIASIGHTRLRWPTTTTGLLCVLCATGPLPRSGCRLGALPVDSPSDENGGGVLLENGSVVGRSTFDDTKRGAESISVSSDGNAPSSS